MHLDLRHTHNQVSKKLCGCSFKTNVNVLEYGTGRFSYRIPIKKGYLAGSKYVKYNNEHYISVMYK